MKLAQAVNQYDYSQLESPPLLELTEEQLAALADQPRSIMPYIVHTSAMWLRESMRTTTCEAC
ncbi:hypothetical protein KFU94_42620 [Chloroflexi bacterium TSY]|nr:hypothetical protein [Chloroflexi bacterium TSY]